MLEPRPSQVERQRWCLFRCRRPPANEDIWGKKWVTLTDPAGTRCAHAHMCTHMLSDSSLCHIPVTLKGTSGTGVPTRAALARWFA